MGKGGFAWKLVAAEIVLVFFVVVVVLLKTSGSVDLQAELT